MSPQTDATPIRRHPQLIELFKSAESRHFTAEELNTIKQTLPDSAACCDAAQAIRKKDGKVVKAVVSEIFSQYDYETHHEFALAKCSRDVRYVITYATHAMLIDDIQWYEDKLLIWLKTILQSFDFPERKSKAGGGMFADAALEDALAKLPKKACSIYHCYYRIHQEMGRALEPDQFELISPFLERAMHVLSEEY